MSTRGQKLAILMTIFSMVLMPMETIFAAPHAPANHGETAGLSPARAHVPANHGGQRTLHAPANHGDGSVQPIKPKNHGQTPIKADAPANHNQTPATPSTPKNHGNDSVQPHEPKNHGNDSAKPHEPKNHGNDKNRPCLLINGKCMPCTDLIDLCIIKCFLYGNCKLPPSPCKTFYPCGYPRQFPPANCNFYYPCPPPQLPPPQLPPPRFPLPPPPLPKPVPMPTPSRCRNHPYPNDIDGHWSEIYVRRLYDLCILDGYSDGSFRPDQGITRSELVKMALSAAKIPPNPGCYDADCGSPFMDLEMWQGPWLRAAWDRHIIEGYSADRFAPNRQINRAEAVKIVLAAFGYQPGSVDHSFFNDVSGWATGWIELAHQYGIIQGEGNGNFDPFRRITRAEAAKIIAKTIEYEDTKIR